MVMKVNFYHLTKSSLLESLPFLMEKVVARGLRAVIVHEDRATLEEINRVLWTYSTKAFLPHGIEGDEFASDQHLWLSTKIENPNQASVLVLTSPVSVHKADEIFERCLDIFEGSNEEDVAKARERWKIHSDQKRDLTYWQQTETGAWAEKTGAR